VHCSYIEQKGFFDDDDDFPTTTTAPVTVVETPKAEAAPAQASVFDAFIFVQLG
jgi:hypothetical protein